MLYRIFSKLFGTDLYRYTPRPAHLLYALLLIAVGTVTMGHGWTFFGFMASFFGVTLGLTIVLGMNWDKCIEYWAQIEYVFNAASKINDTAARYELLKSMGYNIPPSKIEIIETKRDELGVYEMDKSIVKGISPAILQLIADKVLMSGQTDFAEESYGQFVPAIRKVKKQFRDAGIIAQKNKKNVRLGYSFTKKGIETLWQCASDGVKLELERKEMR